MGAGGVCSAMGAGGVCFAMGAGGVCFEGALLLMTGEGDDQGFEFRGCTT
jgi:hypothetical protein